MPTRQAIAAGLVATFLGLLLLILFAPVIAETLNKTPTDRGPGYVALATGVAGYVAGVIALWFGVESPDPFRHFGARLAPTLPEAVQTIVAYGYIAIYFGVALFGGYLFVSQTDTTPELLIAQCTAAAGLAFAIGTKLFASGGGGTSE
jgi:hypothetical protein